MKKHFLSIALVTGIMCLASCGGSSKAEGSDSAAESEATEAVEESAEFTGETYSKEAAEYYMKNSYGVNLADLAPDRKYDEAGEYLFKGEPREVSASFCVVESETFDEAEFDSAVRKAYAATKAASDDNKCIYGFEEKDATAEALAEKPVEEALKCEKSFGITIHQHEWGFKRNGTLCRCLVSASSKDGETVGYVVSIYNGLSKNLDETLDDAAKAIEEIENDPAKKAEVEKALKDAGVK